jgi:hypothetical protein
MTTEPEWGYWLDQPGGTWIMLPKLPLIRAGFNNPPFSVTRPDGKVLNVVERPEPPK